MKWIALLVVLALSGVAAITLGSETLATNHWSLALAAIAAGKAKDCSLSQLVNGIHNEERKWGIANQIQSRFRVLERDGSMVRLQTDLGPFWVLAHDDMRTLAYIMAEEVIGQYGSLSSGDVVADCGSHYGFFTRKSLNAGANVIAIDPSVENMGCFRRTFAQEIRDGRVTVVPLGVWDRDESLPLNVDPIRSWQTSLVLDWSRAAHGSSVPLTTLDRIVRDLSIARVDVIKMDIEGAERRALAGARDTIRRFRPRLEVCLYHLPDDPHAIPAVVKSIDSAYRMECSACKEYFGYRPDVAVFSVH